MWEIFPLEERGTAMAVWGTGIMLAPILGPTVGGYIADNWSWRWIFYINLPIGVIAFFMVSAFLFDAPFHRRPRRVDVAGILLMVVGFGCLQLVLDIGERNDWFDSTTVLMCGVLAACTLVGFVLRELMAAEPILDLTVFSDRNFGIGTLAIFLVGLGFNSSLLLIALYTQTVLGYDAWTAGLTLAPGGLGTMIALMISGRLVSRMDQRLMLAGGCSLAAMAFFFMTRMTPTIDFWNLAWPRFVQGFRPGLHLRAAPGPHPRHHSHGAAGQLDGRLQCRPQYRRRHGRGPGDHPPRATEPGPSGHADGASRPVELRDGGPAAAMDQSFREPWRRHVHGEPAGHEHAVPRDGDAGEHPGLCR